MSLNYVGFGFEEVLFDALFALLCVKFYIRFLTEKFHINPSIINEVSKGFVKLFTHVIRYLGF